MIRLTSTQRLKEKNKHEAQSMKRSHLPNVARAFTLVELLAVMVIGSVLLALIIPAAAGLTGTVGRKGAVNLLLGSFEQARVAALEAGSPVTMVFWRRDFPDQDSFLVLREGTEADADALGAIPKHVFLTGWRRLPTGVIFFNPRSQSGGQALSVMAGGLPGSLSLSDLPLQASQGQASADRFAAVRFNQFGQIEHPGISPMALFIAEGQRNADGSERITGPRDGGTTGGLEKFALSRFTGRAMLEISSSGAN